MKIFAVNGSPRRHGNTESILDAFLKGAVSAGADVKKINLAEIDFKNCRGCNACHKSGKCVITDALTDIFDEISESDILILASPIYSMTVTAEMKGFIDRGQFLWSQKFITKTLVYDDEHLLKHIGVFISTSGQNLPIIFDSAKPTVRAFFNDSGFAYKENILYPGVDAYGGIKFYPNALEEAESKGREIVKKYFG